MEASPRSLPTCKKRMLSSSGKRKTKNAAADAGIERFPDEILINILSYLTIKDAVRTSVLSHRWRYLCWFASGTLDFDLDHWNAAKRRCARMEAAEFETVVNRVIKLHQGPFVDKFIVRCSDLENESHDPICNWISFAVQKDVRVFELDLSQDQKFPDLEKFLSISRAVRPKYIGFSSLTSFTLYRVSITKKMIQYLLSNCPHLEHLSLTLVDNLRNLSIVGPSLKSLVISHCCILDNLMISAANLVSFQFGGASVSYVKFQNVPMLLELTFDGDCCAKFLFFCRYSKIYNQLKNLVLRLPYTVLRRSSEHTSFSFGCPQLHCLNRLEMVLFDAECASLIFFVLLTKACPLLSTFVAQFIYLDGGHKELIDTAAHSYGSEDFQADLKSYRHEHLKLVKLTDFACYRSEFRFALSLLQISKSLERIIIVPGPGYLGRKSIAGIRERAKQLEANLPSGAELLIL